MIIKCKGFNLRPYRKGNEESLVRNINNKKIWRTTMRIPYPYTYKHARRWVAENLREQRKKKPSKINFVIDIYGEVAGSIGLANIEGHKATLGYWLAEQYWGKGIMTEAVGLIANYGFTHLDIICIQANAFGTNAASMRVLEKAGFVKSGILQKATIKDGEILDEHLHTLHPL